MRKRRNWRQKAKRQVRADGPHWNLESNAVCIPYSQVPMAKMRRRMTWRGEIFQRNYKNNPYWCPKCHDGLSFERQWSKIPQKMEVLIPLCVNGCNLDDEWISIAHQLRSKKPKKRKQDKIARKSDFVELNF